MWNKEACCFTVLSISLIRRHGSRQNGAELKLPLSKQIAKAATLRRVLPKYSTQVSETPKSKGCSISRGFKMAARKIQITNSTW
jgi:hypothetical protein